MLFNVPTPFAIDELESVLPCSEEEWAAPSEGLWWAARTSSNVLPSLSFQEAFKQLSLDLVSTTSTRCSEFGSYVLISALLSTALEAHRIAKVSADRNAFEKLDIALENWQRSLGSRTG
jgi:hypothetical protein